MFGYFLAGGIGEAVSHVLAEAGGVTFRHLCVRGVPRSGPPAVLLDMFGISAKNIVRTVRELK